MNASIPFILAKYTELVMSMMCDKYGFDEQQALRKFLFSKTYKMLSCSNLAMWKFVPEVIFEIWECEIITGNPRNAECFRWE